MNPGPADPFTKVEVDRGLFPSAGAAKLGVEVVPPPVVLAEVSMACTVLNKLAQQGASELELFGLPLPLNFQAFVGWWGVVPPPFVGVPLLVTYVCSYNTLHAIPGKTWKT